MDAREYIRKANAAQHRSDLAALSSSPLLNQAPPRRDIYERIDSVEPDALGLWLKYLPVLHDIQTNPRARRAMRHDPGVVWMKRGCLIAFVIFVLLIVAFNS